MRLGGGAEGRAPGDLRLKTGSSVKHKDHFLSLSLSICVSVSVCLVQSLTLSPSAQIDSLPLNKKPLLLKEILISVEITS